MERVHVCISSSYCHLLTVWMIKKVLHVLCEL